MGYGKILPQTRESFKFNAESSTISSETRVAVAQENPESTKTGVWTQTLP